MPARNAVNATRVLQLAQQGADVRAIATRLAISLGAVYAVLRRTKEGAK